MTVLFGGLFAPGGNGMAFADGTPDDTRTAARLVESH
jgi:hypothetical protein